MSAPLSDIIINTISKLVDDAQSNTREPSHSDIGFEIDRAGLKAGDPKTQGQSVGKAKRVRNTLSWALENDIIAGQKLVAALISLVRGRGGFRPTSDNFVGVEAITNISAAFREEGYELSTDGELRQLLLDNLSGTALTNALESYVRRAKRGADDAALVTGTGKDLLEATAAHIIVERFGSYSHTSNFPTLLGQAFTALGLATDQYKVQPGDPPQKRIEKATYELACALNNLRNKTGTGHGRPWLPSVSDAEARMAIQFIGTITELLLETHKKTP